MLFLSLYGKKHPVPFPSPPPSLPLHRSQPPPSVVQRHPDLEIAETPMRDWVKWDSGASVAAYAARMAVRKPPCAPCRLRRPHGGPQSPVVRRYALGRAKGMRNEQEGGGFMPFVSIRSRGGLSCPHPSFPPVGARHGASRPGPEPCGPWRHASAAPRGPAGCRHAHPQPASAWLAPPP